MDKILISNKVCPSEKVYKYFTCYKDDDCKTMPYGNFYTSQLHLKPRPEEVARYILLSRLALRNLLDNESI